MWLSPDERRLLAGYYRTIGKPGQEEAYHLAEAAKLFEDESRTIQSYEETGGEVSFESTAAAEKGEPGAEVAAYLEACSRVEHGNELLHYRGMVKLTPHSHERFIFVIELTLKGYDLGRRYASWFSRTGLWFQEFRHHWIWLIVSFLGGIFGALLVQWLSTRPDSST